MNMPYQTRRAFLSSVGGAALLAACGQNGTTKQAGTKAAAGSAPGEIVLNRGNAAEPLSLDPHHAQGNW